MYSDLSSGERNILSILEKIYFGTSDDVFLLIDEPEISLHISWQMKLIELISKINANKKKTQILIATHSPFIGTYHDDVIAEVKIKDVIQ